MSKIGTSEATYGFQTSALLGNGATYDSGVLNLTGFTQVQTHVLSDVDGTIDIEFIRDAAGTDVLRTLQIPYTGGSGYETFSAPAFTPYVRYQFTADQAGQSDFYFDTKFLSTGLTPQVLGATAFISPKMVSTLGRSILVGQDGAGSFANVTTVATSNAAGSYTSLQTVNGARPSEITGRTAITVVMNNVVASANQYSVTGGKKFYVTDILITVLNTSTANTGDLHLEDGNGGTIVLPVLTAQGKTNEPQLTTVTHTFAEPIEFSTEVYAQIVAGTLDVSGVLTGYEE